MSSWPVYTADPSTRKTPAYSVSVNPKVVCSLCQCSNHHEGSSMSRAQPFQLVIQDDATLKGTIIEILQQIFCLLDLMHNEGPQVFGQPLSDIIHGAAVEECLLTSTNSFKYSLLSGFTEASFK